MVGFGSTMHQRALLQLQVLLQQQVTFHS